MVVWCPSVEIRILSRLLSSLGFSSLLEPRQTSMCWLDSPFCLSWFSSEIIRMTGLVSSGYRFLNKHLTRFQTGIMILSMQFLFLVKFLLFRLFRWLLSCKCWFPLPFKFQLCIIIKGGVKETNIVFSGKKVKIRLNLLLFQLFLAITFILRQMHTVWHVLTGDSPRTDYLDTVFLDVNLMLSISERWQASRVNIPLMSSFVWWPWTDECRQQSTSTHTLSVSAEVKQNHLMLIIVLSSLSCFVTWLFPHAHTAGIINTGQQRKNLIGLNYFI